MIAPSALIDDLRQRIPDMPREGCGQCCGGLIPWTAEEFARLTDEQRRAVLEDSTINRCGLLDTHNRCTAYEQRPLICRLFGTVPRLPCPKGCISPTPLAADDERTIMRRYLQLYLTDATLGRLPNVIGNRLQHHLMPPPATRT